MIENNENKPTKESELDITELLRRYMPEEYGNENSDVASDATDSGSDFDGMVREDADGDADVDVGGNADSEKIKDYGAFSTHKSKSRKHLVPMRHPEKRKGNEHEVGKVNVFSETDANIESEEIDDNMFIDSEEALKPDNSVRYSDSVSNDAGTANADEDEEIVNIYDNIEDFEPDGIAKDESESEATGVYELGSFGKKKDFDPDIDIFSEFEEPADELYDYVDEAFAEGGTDNNAEGSVKDDADNDGDEDGSGSRSDEDDGSDVAEADENIENKDNVENSGDSENGGTDEETENESSEENADMNDFDVNIMLALGMEDELEQTIGVDKVSRFVEKQQGDLEKSKILSRERAALDYEYTNKSQTREVAEAYQTEYKNSKIKLVFASVLAFALLLFECHSTFGIELGGAFAPTVYPVVYIMVGFQLLLLIAAPALRSAYNGIKSFFSGKPSPESVLAFSLLLTSVYNIVVSFVSNYGSDGPVTFNFPAAVGILMFYIYEFINIRREIFSFSVISSKKPKYTLQNLSMAESHLEHEAFSDMMEEDDDAEDIGVLKIECADFINDYFLRTNRYPNGRKFIGFVIPAAVIVAAVFFAYAFNATDSLYGGIKAAVAAALMCLPVSVFYMFSHPFYRANEKAYEDESTIVGEGSVEEYADAAIISFDDKNVFPSTGVNVRGINVFGNNRIDTVLYYAASVFCTVGGPLSDVFDLATRDIGYSSNVELLRSLPGLLEAEVDGDVISLGTIDALETAGIKIPAPLEQHRNDSFDPTISVMYMVKNGKFISRMLVSYVVDSDFEFILKQLDRGGMFIGIKTYDPNITEQFIASQVNLADYPVRIIRCKTLDDKTKVTDATVSGLVSKDSPKSVLQTVTLCEKVLHARSVNTMILIISLFVSLIVTALSILFNAMTLSPLFIALYALFWIIPMFIVSKVII